ncbi:MAG TPA: hypothetical protein VGO58_07090, partial [Chitinophagaceae bacterium]|nr:hypothetical protein [Chitinophagaceae bacterium]
KEMIALLRKQVTTGAFNGYWQNMFLAARYCLENNINLDEGLQWAYQSVNGSFGAPHFNALSTLAGLLDKLGKKEESDSVLKKALAAATMTELNAYAGSILRKKRVTEAFDLFNLNYERNPGAATAVIGMARGHAARGNNKEALYYARKALALAPDEKFKAMVEKMILALKEGKDIDQ